MGLRIAGSGEALSRSEAVSTSTPQPASLPRFCADARGLHFGQVAHTERRTVVSDDEAHRGARNQALYREANEKIQELNAAFEELAALSGTWVCECPDANCTEMLELTLAEYESLRAYPNRFAVLARARGRGGGPRCGGARRLRDHREAGVSCRVCRRARSASRRATAHGVSRHGPKGRELLRTLFRKASRRPAPRTRGAARRRAGATDDVRPVCACSASSARSIAPTTSAQQRLLDRPSVHLLERVEEHPCPERLLAALDTRTLVTAVDPVLLAVGFHELVVVGRAVRRHRGSMPVRNPAGPRETPTRGR